jgi:hypothetical protein
VSITEPMQTAPEQQGAPFEARPVPLFRIDPGWPFVIAGLLLLVAGVLIPAQRDLHELRNSLAIHKAVEDRTVRQLAAYDRFLTDLDAAEPQLVNRLAASQLNLMPKDERSMLLVPTLNSTVTDWIEDSEPMVMPTTSAYPDTLLSRLATGPRRLWVLAAGAFLVFVGLMLSPSAPSAGRRARGPASPVPSHDPVAARGESSALAAAVPAAVAVAGAAAVDGSADIVASESAVESAVAVSSHEVISEVPAVENVGAIESRIESSMTTVVPATIESSEDDSVAQHAAEVVEAIAAVETPALASIESIEPAFVGAADAESLEESLEESLAESLEESLAEVVAVEAEAETIVSDEAIVEVKPVIEHHVAAGIADEAESDLESELEQEAEHGTEYGAEHEAEHGAESSFGVELDGEVDVDAEIEDEIEAEMDSDSEVEVDAFARADHEESSARVDEADGAADEGVEIESIERADTPALPGELEHDADGEVDAVATATIEATIPEVTPVTPSANDRALDTWSLFEGLSPERGSGRR